jgi:hypothetical protein
MRSLCAIAPDCSGGAWYDDCRNHVVKIYFLKKGVSSGRRRLPATRRSAAKFGACPVAPPAATTVYARTLHRACEILGGVPQLADHLRVPARLLRRWLEGRDMPPTAVFVAALDVVLLYVERGGAAKN